MARGSLLALVAAISAGAFADAAAEESAACDCRRDCAERADPSVGLAFDHEEHRLWYGVRFWTGQCHASLSWCWSGQDWYDVMETVLDRVPVAEQAELCPRVFELGRVIGHEWARDNNVRRISTGDLDSWRGILLEGGDPVAAVERVESLAGERLR